VTLQPGGYLAEATLFAVAPFAMARYPVTNACYAGFVQAGGYENGAWWSVAGWAARATTAVFIPGAMKSQRRSSATGTAT
jgi:formylglycine-generating enzyme required for sulfatase activity